MWLALLLACRAPDTVTVHADAELATAIGDLVAFTEDERLTFEVDDDPLRLHGPGWQIGVALDEGCAGCWRLVVDRRRIEVHAGDRLGAQYGVTDALERLGWRFLHPFDTARPEALTEPDPDGALHTPAVAERGLDPHTLHPIEGHAALWQPGAENLDWAKRIVNWTVEQRGNHLQYPGLDDIVAGDDSAWLAHTRAITDYAHERGLTVGLGVQLFGTSNLQLAYDLVDSPSTPALDRAGMDQRVARVAEGNFDRYDLSFGEFFGEDPDVFIDYLDTAVDAFAAAAPEATLTSVIHVGNPATQTVTYDGQEMIYYFLAQYADPRLVPNVHSVMYYNLYEDAGGSYGMENYDPQRTFLLDRVDQGLPVGYFPETAYWVSFDVNVPTYLPIYLQSRLTDLQRLDDDGALAGLDRQLLFSSGWEWGYWQNDYLAMRMAYEVPADVRGPLRELWSPWGDDGRALADAIAALAEVQHDALLVGRLASYLAGWDVTQDVGAALDIVSQPPRLGFAEVVAWDPATRAAFAADVPPRLVALADETDAIRATVPERDDPWFAETTDGMAVTALRARFSAAVYRAAIAAGDGADGSADLAEAERWLADARVIVDRRHTALHAPPALASRLISSTDDNSTIYPFGYLARAEELCFWNRELAQAKNLFGAAETVPGCAF